MIDCYMFATPNCWKVSITLEELELPYTVHWINIREDAQKTVEFKAVSPIGKVPVIVDGDGNGEAAKVYGSPAILFYLAEKTGKLMPQGGGAKRAEALEWIMFAISDIGMAFNGRNRFKFLLPEQDEYAINNFQGEIERYLALMEDRLADHEFLLGDYSIADIAAFPFMGGPRRDDELLAKFPSVKRWVDAIEARPATQRGLRTEP
jgi:glutathione S-transferase